MGYLGMEQKTREAIDDERWLHTGDIGRMDEVNVIISKMNYTTCCCVYV